MKKLIIFSVVLLSTIIARSQFQTANLTAAGLTCAMCTKAIYKSIEKVPTVKNVDVDIKNSQFVITFKEGVSVDPDKLKDAVEQAGFSVSKLSLTGNFDHLKIDRDAHTEIDGKTFHFVKSKNEVLNGSQTLVLVDRNYVTAKQFKKVAALTDHPCVETGRAEECCVKMGSMHNERIYHVML